MIFEEIRIFNLFSYYGEQTFKLPPPTQDKPIVLISGRNGFGKTSFINSVKLLFLGTADEMMNNVQAGRKLRPNSYLLGVDREWQGVFNSRARREDKRGTRYGICIAWREAQGHVEAQRYWTLFNGEPEQHLVIKTDFETDFGHETDDPEIVEEFLEHRLPRNVVRFFFYDGEQIQTMAEANREGQLKEIERLLDIAAIDTLDEYLRKAIAQWKQDGLAADARAELERLQAQHQLKAAERAAQAARFDECQHDIDDLEREIRRNQRQIDTIRSRSLQRDEPRLQEQLKRCRDAYEAACQDVAGVLPTAAPLWAAADLVAQVSHELSAASTNPNQALTDQLGTIMNALPGRLLDEPLHPVPPLSDVQKRFYRDKLAAICAQYTAPQGNGFFSLSTAQATALNRRFAYFAQAKNERTRLAEDLERTAKAGRALKDAQLALDAVGDASPEEQEAFRLRKQAITEAEGKRDALVGQRSVAEHEIRAIDKELEKLAADIRNQDTRQVKLGINAARIDRARQAQALFETYKRELKNTRRTQIEAAINARLAVLMTSHGLIERIEVDEDFGLTYRDRDGNEVGMANISAGMKQLTAQALLWALSEVTTKHIPIIVDTPLARIDRQHQENLLSNYYPKAAQQIFVLPTDSEIDKDKYRLLQPHLSAEFRLQNDTGDQTAVLADKKMYEMETQ